MNENATEDFRKLTDGSKVVDMSMQNDDNMSRADDNMSRAAPIDLRDMLTHQASGSSLKYFIRSPTKVSELAMGHGAERVQQIEESAQIPIPEDIREQLRYNPGGEVFASFTGIIPEISRVWITVDNVLYLWNYSYGDDYLAYEGIDEVIYSVTAVCPKKDTFNDSVAYLLVVVTPVEVTLLAVVKDSPMADRNGIFKLHSIQPTKYLVPSDNLTFSAVAGSSTGRIFLAGDDCNLYEFEYTNEESSWKYLLGIGPNFSCKKRKYGCANSMTGFFNFLGGEEDALVGLVVDDVRRLLYATSKKGKVCVFYLHPDQYPTQVISVNIMDKAKSYRQWGLGTNPRSYYKKDDEVKGVHIVPVEESSKIHGLIVMTSGIRIYFGLKAAGGLAFVPQLPESSLRPTDLYIEHIRLPFRYEEIKKLQKGEYDLDDDGYQPALPSAERQKTISKTLYSNGSYFCAMEGKENQNILINAKMEWVYRENSMAYELRENLCGFRHAATDTLFEERVVDLREVSGHLFDTSTSKLHRLFFASRRPDGSDTTTARRKAAGADLEPVPGPASCLPFLARECGSGYANDDLGWLHRQNEMSSQMLPTLARTTRQFLCLTSKALHIITQRRPIDYLYAMLQTGREDSSEGIKRRLFDYYGIAQCAAMCVAIACDLPNDVSSTLGGDRGVVSTEVHETLKYKAIGVMKHITHTRMPLQIKAANAQQPVNAKEHSDTYYALYQVFSRVVRPLWYRFFVKVIGSGTEGAISPIVAIDEINAINAPLKKMVQILRYYHRDAIDSQGVARNQGEGLGGGQKTNVGNPTGISAVKYRENEARLAENRALNTFYRLLTRTSQALDMMGILIEAHEGQKLRVKWEKMADMTFVKIVTNSDYHEKIQSILQDLVCNQEAPSAGYDIIMSRLQKDCFLFFSVGNVHYYRGSKELEGAFAAPQNSKERDRHTDNAVREMCEAARYWRSKGDVEKDENGSCYLEDTCNKFLKLGEIGQEGVVSVCMAAAKCFGGGDSDSPNLLLTTQAGWEEGLYHSGSIVEPHQRHQLKMVCYQALIDKIRKVHEAEYLAIGAGIVDHDAILATNRNINVMIQRAVNSTKDLHFHQELYTFLIAKGLSDCLLRLNTIHVEEFLRSFDSPDKLHQYFELHNRYIEAMDLMASMAVSDDIPLPQRIEYLNKAVRSADAACRNPDPRDPQNRFAVDSLNDLKERLRRAEFQLKLADKMLEIEGKVKERRELHGGNMAMHNDPAMKKLQDLIYKVNNTLMSYEDMFKEITVPFGLWEESLEIIHDCSYEDEALVKKLWRSIIFSIIPREGSDEELRREVDNWRRQLHDSIFVDNFVDNMRVKVGVSLEQPDGYIQELRAKILDLGRILNAAEGCFVFPLPLLIEDMEKLVALLYRTIGFNQRTFIIEIFRDIGIRFNVLVEAYVNAARRHSVHSANEAPKWDLVQLAWVAAELVVIWTKLAESNGPDQEVQDARTSLRMEIRSGRMRSWLKNELGDIIQRAQAYKDANEDYAVGLKVTKNKIDEATKITENYALSKNY